jgi:peroxiredoxin
MQDNGIAAGASDVKDRKTGLVVFGIFEILLGAFLALMVPVMMFGMFAASSVRAGSGASMSANMAIPTLLFYVALAVWFIWMGIGSIQARRWARALLLITSWLGLIGGTTGLIGMLVIMPDMYDQMSNGGLMPSNAVSIIRNVTVGFMVVFYVIIPGVCVLFYGSKHTKATCERRDPQVRWTDRCPLPVLAAGLMFGFCAVCMPLMGFYGWAVPFFGVILSGFAGAVVSLAGALLLGTVAWGLYRLSVKAWWFAVLTVMAWGASYSITFSRANLADLYEKMGFPIQQLEMMKTFSFFSESSMVLFPALWLVPALAGLLYIRRYLSQQEVGAPVTAAAPLVEPVPPPPLPPSLPSGAPSGGLAIASFVLGVLAVLLGLFVIGGVLGIAGLILGVIHLARSRSRRVLAGWGIGLSAIGLALTIAVAVLFWMVVKPMIENFGTEGDSFRSSAWIGKPVPEMTLTALDGSTIRTAEWKGHPVVLDMWASWHPACVAAIPDFARLVAETSTQGVQVLAVTFEDSADLGGFVTNRSINYPIVATTNLPAPFSDVESIPTTFFINADGIIRDIRVGYEGYDVLKQSALDRSAPAVAKEQEEDPNE